MAAALAAEREALRARFLQLALELVDSLGLAYRWYLQCSTMTHVDTVLFGVPAGAR